MKEVYQWVLSIVGVVLIGALVDIILPEGKTRKFIQSIYAIFVMFVILTPLPKVLNANFDINFGSSIMFDDEFLQNIYRQRIEVLEKDILEKCSKEGVENIGVSIVVDSYSESMKITNIIVDTSAVKSNISDYKKTVKDVIKSMIKIDEKLIVI